MKSAEMNQGDQNERKDQKDPGLVLMQEVVRQDQVSQLIAQVNKDFRLCGLEGSIPEGALPQEVVSQLNQQLGRIIRDDFQGFLNLLYRVDIPESRIRRNESEGMEEFVRNCSYELLKREWQKVWLRNRNL